MEPCPALSQEALERRIDDPVGCPPLEDLAQGRRDACIVVDDLTRPTPADRVLPIILKKLNTAGIPNDRIKVVMAIGAHRPMTGLDLEKKLGRPILNAVEVFNHNPYASDLARVDSKEGLAPVTINSIYARAALKISVGCIVPHSLAGYSGGGKNIIPGIGGIETLKRNHRLVFRDGDKERSFEMNALNPDNPLRRDMETLVKSCGLDFIVNVVFNSDMKIAAAFCGDFIAAHRAACECARRYYATPLVRDADVVVLNDFPKDTEYSQIGTVYCGLGKSMRECVALPDGSVVLTTAASEGAGYHALFGPGMELFAPHDLNVPPKELRGSPHYLFSTGVTELDIRKYFSGRPMPVFGEWGSLLDAIRAKHGTARVAVYTHASMQIGY